MMTVPPCINYVLWGLATFNFCLNMVLLLIVIRLWLEIYHVRWMDTLKDFKDGLKR